MAKKLYAERDPRGLDPHFSAHMMAMTAEDLHDKAAIAEELAYRDQQIERLTAENERKDALVGRLINAVAAFSPVAAEQWRGERKRI